MAHFSKRQQGRTQNIPVKKGMNGGFSPGYRPCLPPYAETQLLDPDDAEDRPVEEMVSPTSAETAIPRESFRCRSLMTLLGSLLRLLDAYSLLVFVLLGIALAAADPRIGVDNGPLRSAYSISYGATILIFLIMGIGLDASDLLAHLDEVGIRSRG